MGPSEAEKRQCALEMSSGERGWCNRETRGAMRLEGSLTSPYRLGRPFPPFGS